MSSSFWGKKKLFRLILLCIALMMSKKLHVNTQMELDVFCVLIIPVCSSMLSLSLLIRLVRQIGICSCIVLIRPSQLCCFNSSVGSIYLVSSMSWVRIPPEQFFYNKKTVLRLVELYCFDDVFITNITSKHLYKTKHRDYNKGN